VPVACQLLLETTENRDLNSTEKLLLETDTTVTCPECEHEFSLEQGFAKKALEHLSTATSSAIKDLQESVRAEASRRAERETADKNELAQAELTGLRELLAEQTAAHQRGLTELRERAAAAADARVAELQKLIDDKDAEAAALKSRETAIAARERELEGRVAELASARAAELFASEKQALEERLQRRDTEVADLRAVELSLRRDKAAVEDRAAQLEIEVARKLDAGRADLEAKVRAQEQERTALEKAELQKKLDDVSTQLLDTQRRMAQGSQQLQGEVLELAIEEGLRRAFPLDTIEEVKKGQRGGDVLQHVVTRSGQVAGTILWETKRAKDWSTQWIPKLKDDMRSCGAAVAILVTMPEALPKDWPASAYFALRDEVWVTQSSCAMGIAEALRIGLTDLYRQRQVSAGKNEKAEALYDYLTSPQFAQKLSAVYETFKRMQDELESEKSQMSQRWARREKQLQIGTKQLLSIGGEIQGLAQQDLPVLELESPPSGED
jgi:hypothetical protein